MVEVEHLKKTFHIGFFRKRVEAVRDVSFEVRRGEILGILGPNGAGKTTTIKSLLGLIFPTSGTVRLCGQPEPTREARRRVGYMPENPYVYSYLKPLEFLDLCGRLVGLSRQERRERGRAIVERVGLSHAVDRPIGKFSKGMTQRIGLAQALLHDPDLLILDEPMSGLDPIGRKEVRDLLLEQRRAGKTLLFTSHILTDVESLCDRVVIVRSGEVAAEGVISELVGAAAKRVEIELTECSEPLQRVLRDHGEVRTSSEGRVEIAVEGKDEAAEVVRLAVDGGANVEAVVPNRESLEALFMRNAVAPSPQAEDAATPRP
ncbi:MAG: ABC transporter ATP-binding protein [Myxococcales bacterium]|nr:ABC transporter ATP-binding protein [Myxococcales bacterium]